MKTVRKTSEAILRNLHSEETNKKLSEPTVDPFTSDEPQILFLGTSAQKYTKHRNVSAIYYFGRQGSVLMDCGEGTYGQLWDHFACP